MTPAQPDPAAPDPAPDPAGPDPHQPDAATPPPAPLRAAVLEIEGFVAASGFSGRRTLFALVPTAELLAHEPGLIGQLGDDRGGADLWSALEAPASLTPVEQESLPGSDLAEALAKIAWPDEVAGCALALEIIVDAGAQPGSADHTDHAEGRLVVGVLREGPPVCVLRWRHAPDGPLTESPDLAPELAAALRATLVS